MASQNKGRLQIQPTVRAKKKAPCIILGENQGLIVAEVELESENQDFPKPGWVLEEVTGDPRYFNSNLIKNPYKVW